MSTKIVVGGRDCQIPAILSVINSPNSLALLHTEWSGIATTLDIPSYRIQVLRQGLLFNNLALMDVMCSVIEEWVGRKGSDATLDKLIAVFEMQTCMNACGESLRLQFNLPCKESENPSLSWEQLPNSFKDKVTKNLKEFWPDIELDEESKSTLPRAILIDLMTGKQPFLFKNTIPEELKYYLPRTLITRNVLTNKIFELTSGTFLVSGMERHELSGYLKKGQTDNSSNQLDNRDKDVHFMVLDQPSHLAKIESDGSVHHLNFAADKFRLVRSRGPLTVVHRCLHKSQDYLVENKFLAKISLRMEPNSPVCFSDSPGMGKSVLSKHIARSLRTSHPERIVIFQEFPEFIKGIRKVKVKNQPLSCASIQTVLKSTICDNELEKAIFKSKLESEVVTAELVFDGYDELSAASFKLVDEFIQTAQSQFKSIRLWITTRPHLLEKLENILGVLGYNIQAFTEEDQIKFLTSFWARNHSRLLSTERLSRLTEFATQCLKNLKSTINAKDEDIAGIPLQCRMIGEVYEEEATEFSQTDSLFSGIKIIVSSITNLYQRTIEAKIRKYKTTYRNLKLGEDDLWEMHVQMSLKLVLPANFKKMKSMFRKVEVDDMLNVGIVEHAGTVGKPRFIHRTFAEYFVSWFVLNRLKSANAENNWYDELNELLFEGILSSVVKKSSHLDEFNNPVMCFFLNSLLSQETIISVPTNKFSETLNDSSTMCRIARACANSNCLSIFGMFNRLDAFKLHEKAIFTADFVLDTIQKSEIQFVKTAIACFESHSEFDINLQIKALRIAVEKGRFDPIEVLLQDKQLREIMKDGPTWERMQILHCCVENSKDNPEEVIKEKTKIIEYLYEKNPSIIEEKNEEQVTPLLCKDVHIKLLLKLIDLDANVLAGISENLVSTSTRSKQNDTVLHISYLTPEEYLQLLKTIPLEKLERLVRVQGSNLDTPLFRLIRSTDLNDETLDIFSKASADFNVRNKYGDGSVSLLALAIIKSRSSKTVKKLIQCGAACGLDWKHKFSGNNLLHVEARRWGAQTGQGENRAECIKRIKVLIEHGADVNKKNVYGCLFLHYFFSEETTLTPTEFHDIVESLVLNEQFENGECKSLLALAIEKLKVEEKTLTLLHSNEVKLDPSVNDDDEKFALKWAIENGGDKNSLSCLIKFGADINWKGPSGESLLHVAAASGNLNAITFLLANNLSANAPDNENETPLHYAANCWLSCNLDMRWKIIKTLIENGADMNTTNEDGKTYLHIYLSKSRYNNFDNDVEFLIETNQVKLFNVQDKNGVAPLHLAVEHHDVTETTLSVLHSNGVKFDLIDNKGRSVLSLVIKNTSAKISLSSMIKFGADVNWKGESGESLLHVAAKSGNLIAIDVLLANNLGVNAPDNENETPLHYAAKKYWLLSSGNFEINWKIIKALIANGADMNTTNIDGETFLHMYLQESSFSERPKLNDLVEFLIGKHQVKLFNVQDKNGVTPLHVAVKTECVTETMSLLHLKGVKFDVIDNNGDSLLTYSIIADQSTYVLSQLVKFGADPKLLNKSCRSLLHVAADEVHLNAVKYCIDLHLDVNGKDGDGNTPLHVVVLTSSGWNWDRLSIAKVLVGNGAKIDVANKDGLTPLEIAKRSEQSHQGIVEYLSERMKHLEQETNSRDGNTELHNAVMMGDIKRLDELVKEGVDVNVQNNNFDTSLHMAAYTKDRTAGLKIIKILLENGANPFLKNTNDANFLHIFLSNHNPLPPSEFHDLVECLVNKKYAKLLDTPGGSDNSTPLQSALFDIMIEEKTLALLSSNGVEMTGLCHHIDSSGNNLLHIAAKQGNLATLKHFLQLGISVNARNSDGNTPLHLAVLSGRDNVSETTTLLVKLGADSNVRNNLGLSPFLIFAQNYKPSSNSQSSPSSSIN